MRPIVLVAMVFGIAAAATNPSHLTPFAPEIVRTGEGVRWARSILLTFGVGLLLGAAFTRVFQRMTALRLGALYAALLGPLINALASSVSISVGGFLDPALLFFTLMNHILLGVLAGLTAWALLRLEKKSPTSPDLQTRLIIAALFAGAAFLIGLSSVLPWEESGDYVSTWRTPATAVAVTTLPAMLMAALLGVILTRYLAKAAFLPLYSGVLYTLLFGFYTAHAAQTWGGSFLSFYVSQRVNSIMPPFPTSSASASYYVVSMGGVEVWRAWVFPAVSVASSLLVWAYLHCQRHA